ncbi:MAG: sugar phosphate isomerase/epimerase family protein [Vibrio sp.]
MTISLAHLTAVDLTPPELIHAAAKAGYDSVGVRLVQVTDTSPGYPLPQGSLELKQTLQAMKDTGVTVNDIEFFKITPDFNVNDIKPYLEMGQLLGAKQLITAPYDDNLARLKTNLAAIAEVAQQYQLETLIEFFPWTCLPDLPSSLDLIKGTQAKILLDVLHFDRSNSSLKDIENAPKDAIGMIHLCDANVLASYTTEQLLHTAREDRCIPGKGEIDLLNILNRIDPAVGIGIEVPSAPCGKLTKAQMEAWIAECYQGAKAVCAQRLS